jgi:predicted transcriptional regulator
MKPTNRLTNAEMKLAELIWENEPIASMKLVEIAKGEFDWSKSTTFTHLKVLIQKEIAKNESSCVTTICTREKYIANQSCQYVDETFGGSLPMFVASFARNRKLTAEQIADLKRLIDEHEEGGVDG